MTSTIGPGEEAVPTVMDGAMWNVVVRMLTVTPALFS